MTQIFISYRRDGGDAVARVLYDRLIAQGYEVFFDVESLRSGYFNKAIYEKIDECTDFLLVLPPNALDRCTEEDDWVRLEIEYAINAKKNIIPVMMEKFHFPATLPQTLERLPYYNGITAKMEFIDSVINKLKKDLLKSIITEKTDVDTSLYLDKVHLISTKKRQLFNRKIITSDEYMLTEFQNAPWYGYGTNPDLGYHPQCSDLNLTRMYIELKETLDELAENLSEAIFENFCAELAYFIKLCCNKSSDQITHLLFDRSYYSEESNKKLNINSFKKNSFFITYYSQVALNDDKYFGIFIKQLYFYINVIMFCFIYDGNDKNKKMLRFFLKNNYKFLKNNGFDNIKINNLFNRPINALNSEDLAYECLLNYEQYSMFNKVKNIQNITIHKPIREFAFEGCKRIQKIDIRNSIVEIRYSAFANCENLKFINLPDSLQYIGPHAFKRCFSLCEVKIPENVNRIGFCAFEECYNLKKVIITSKNTEIEFGAFSECNSDLVIYAPEDSFAKQYAEKENILFKILDN